MLTPVCALGVRTSAIAVTEVAYLPPATPAIAPGDPIAARAVREIERYLADPGFRFTVPLAPRGTAFQQRVWDAIGAIVPGESRTYGELARRLATAARAVGQACGANPISLLIPCHRVIGGGGALGGFMGSGAGFALDLGLSRSQPELLPAPTAKPAPTGPATLVDPASIKRWLLAHERARIGA